MKTRKIVSIILCTVFLLLSLAVFALMKVINTGGHPGISSSSFAPARVIKVSDEKDIIVTVYPTGGITPHGANACREVNLNCIKKGWLVTQHQGNCRLLFEIKDADMEDFCGIGDSRHYYYAEIIPSDRLWITDFTARHSDEPTDPFNKDTHPSYLVCCINSDLYEYRFARHGILYLIGFNTGFILLITGINVLINKISIAKAKKKASQNT